MRCRSFATRPQQQAGIFPTSKSRRSSTARSKTITKRRLDAVRWEVATKLDPVQISFIAAPKMRVGEPYIRKEDIPLFEKAHAQGGMEGLIKAIPDSYVEGMTASGTPDEVKKRVQQYRDAGVKIPLLRPAAAHQTQRLLDLFAQ